MDGWVEGESQPGNRTRVYGVVSENLNALQRNHLPPIGYTSRMIETIHLQFLPATFDGWVVRRQARVMAFLIGENRVLNEKLESRGRRLRFILSLLEIHLLHQ